MSKNVTETSLYGHAGIYWYKIECSCYKLYIGKSNRKFNTRYDIYIMKFTVLNLSFSRHGLCNRNINFGIN